MITPVRQEILRQLQLLSEVAPDVRFGQLIANLAFLAAGPFDQTLWDLEDAELLGAIQQHLSDLSARQADDPVDAAAKGSVSCGIHPTT